jgi:hypothetical protein
MRRTNRIDDATQLCSMIAIARWLWRRVSTNAALDSAK